MNNGGSLTLALAEAITSDLWTVDRGSSIAFEKFMIYLLSCDKGSSVGPLPVNFYVSCHLTIMVVQILPTNP